jgi:hypothetical protein
MYLRLNFIVVLGLLICGSALLEFPELITLTDNTSNDVVCPASASETKAAIAVRRESRPAPVLIDFQREEMFPLTPSHTSAPQQDVLRMTCILQT